MPSLLGTGIAQAGGVRFARKLCRLLAPRRPSGSSGSRLAQVPMTPCFAVPRRHALVLARPVLALGMAAYLSWAVAARADAPVPIVHLVADSASGNGPYASPS